MNSMPPITAVVRVMMNRLPLFKVLLSKFYKTSLSAALIVVYGSVRIRVPTFEVSKKQIERFICIILHILEQKGTG
jgi:hypothetical protein